MFRCGGGGQDHKEPFDVSRFDTESEIAISMDNLEAVDKQAMNTHRDGGGDGGETCSHMNVKRLDHATGPMCEAVASNYEQLDNTRKDPRIELPDPMSFLATAADWTESWTYLLERGGLVVDAAGRNDDLPYHVPDAPRRELHYDQTLFSTMLPPGAHNLSAKQTVVQVFLEALRLWCDAMHELYNGPDSHPGDSFDEATLTVIIRSPGQHKLAHNGVKILCDGQPCEQGMAILQSGIGARFWGTVIRVSLDGDDSDATAPAETSVATRVRIVNLVLSGSMHWEKQNFTWMGKIFIKHVIKPLFDFPNGRPGDRLVYIEKPPDPKYVELDYAVFADAVLQVVSEDCERLIPEGSPTRLDLAKHILGRAFGSDGVADPCPLFQVLITQTLAMCGDIDTCSDRPGSVVALHRRRSARVRH